MRKIMICSLAVTLLISTTAAFGAVKEEGFSVTPLIGGYIFDANDSMSPSLVRGARVGYNITKSIGIEALYDYVTNVHSLSGPSPSLHRFGGQALYHFFPDNVFVPYLAAGFSEVLLRDTDTNRKNHGAFDYGVGAKYFLTDDFAVRGDVRHIYFSSKPDTFNNIEFTLGAYFQFGGTAPAAKAVEPETISPSASGSVQRAVVPCVEPGQVKDVPVVDKPGAVRKGSYSVTPMIGSYNYDNKQELDKSLLLGVRAGYSITDTIGIEALYDYVTRTDTSTGSLKDVTMNRYGGQLLYHVFPVKELFPYLAVGFSGVNFRASGMDSKTRGAFDFGVGAKYFLFDDFAIRGDIRNITYKYNSETVNNLEFTLGAHVQFGGIPPVVKPVICAPEPVDSDGDGVPDYLDKCPGTPPEVKVDKDGCPIDSDGNGVPDYRNKCLGTPRGVKVDKDGCPIDSDGNGVPDYRNKCIGTPRGVKVDKDGCPIDSDGNGVPDYRNKCIGTPRGVKIDKDGCPIDSDGNGVPDYRNKCLGTPRGVAVDKDGCPIDSDGDGVPDYLDKCPITPPGVPVDANGCPVEVAKLVQRFCDKPVVMAITFEYNKADIKVENLKDIDKLGSFLKEFPSSKGTIDGHASAEGTLKRNTALSNARAENVRTYLMKKFGIDGSRITAKGYGSTKPIASNKNEAGRAKNRRIEAVFNCE